MSDVIGEGKVVSIHFTLQAEGQTLDTTQDGEPLLYLHGVGGVVPGLEAALAGKAVGDHVVTNVEPADGYGERKDEPAMRVPRNQFPADFPAQPGVPVGGEDEEGNVFTYWITQVEDDHVVVDPNHPLAGVRLEFDVRVIEVRDATESEMEHGHPHGPGGAHH